MGEMSESGRVAVEALWSRGRDGLAILRNGSVVEANDRFIASCGLSEPLDSSIDELFRRVGLVHSHESGEDAIACAVDPIRVLARCGDHSATVYELSIVSLDSGDELVVLRDLPMEQQGVAQVLSSETTGLLVAGFAHDINNTLSPILAYADLLAQEELLPRQRERVHQVRRAALKLRELNTRLIAFAREDEGAASPTDLNGAVRDVHELMRRVVQDSVQIRLCLAGQPCFVLANSVQLHRILLNLVINAQDAMPDGGLVEISVRVESGDRPMAELAVLDHGSGIESAVLDRVFDPFFTTKGALGTGLGLTTVRRIVEQLGGTVSIQSRVDAGTTAEVRLPLVESSVEAVALDSGLGESAGSDSVILVVEGDDMVRGLAQQVLAQAGFEVRVAPTVELARNWLHAPSPAIDLLLTDIGMPGARGCELAELARELRPEIQVLFMSSDLPSVAPEAARGRLLQKPFSATELVQRVCRALDSDRR